MSLPKSTLSALFSPLGGSAGFFYGITGAIHSVVGELSDETNQSTAFPLYDIISALGFVIGSAASSVHHCASCSPLSTAVVDGKLTVSTAAL